MTATAGRPPDYIPALRFSWLTPLYDRLIGLTMRESTFKRALVDQAGIARGQRVLDLGCGTGTLTLLVKGRRLNAAVFGLDADPRALAIAREKAARAGLDLMLDQGSATSLPYPDNFFDRVLSSLLLHHLTHDQKRQALAETLRTLRPGGELHVADWGAPRNMLLGLAFLLVRVLDGFATTADNARGHLPQLCRDAGFTAVETCAQYATPFGTLTLYRARKPGAEAVGS